MSRASVGESPDGEGVIAAPRHDARAGEILDLGFAIAGAAQDEARVLAKPWSGKKQ